MKKLLTLLLLIYPLSITADPWDNMTLEEAEAVKAFLSKTPFVLSYCDCCDYEGEYATRVYLLKVISAEIVPCDWDNSSYSVKTSVEIIAELPYNDNGLDFENPLEASKLSEHIITMNYTWSYAKDKNKVVPLYVIIPYDEYGENKQNSGSCREFTSFPNPFKTKGVISDKDYQKWYKENIGN